MPFKVSSLFGLTDNSLDNKIGENGAKAINDGLKINIGLHELELFGILFDDSFYLFERKLNWSLYRIVA